MNDSIDAPAPSSAPFVPGVPGLFPVGRLDVTTEGLILLPNGPVSTPPNRGPGREKS